MPDFTPIPIEQLRDRCVYRIHGRNLRLGVFEAETQQFHGIRLKFNSMFVDAEDHRPIERTHGPCFAYRTSTDTGEPLDVMPGHISFAHLLGSYDEVTKRPVAFDRPRAEGGRGWHFADDGPQFELDPEEENPIRPCARTNWTLKHYLLGIEAMFNPEFAANMAFCKGEYNTLREAREALS